MRGPPGWGVRGSLVSALLVIALHNHHTRQAKNKNYFLSNTLTSQCSNGLLVNGSEVWNELSNKIKSEARLHNFSSLVTSRSNFSVLTLHHKFQGILLFEH